MNRFLRMLLLAVLLAPTAVQVLHPIEEACAEEREDCCEPDGRCDVNCVQCACCVPRAVVFTTSVSADNSTTPPTRGALALAEAPPGAPISDILHIPKSV